MNRNNKFNAEEPAIDNAVVRWLANFWYHYKWHVLVTVFFVVTFVFCFAQCSGNEQSDIAFSYLDSGAMTTEQQMLFRSAVAGYLESDVTGDGKIIASMYYYTYYSSAELEEYKHQTNQENGGVSDAVILQMQKDSQDNLTAFQACINAGDSVILFLHPDVYRKLEEGGQLISFADLFGTAGEESVYGVRFSETAIARSHPEINYIPEHTMVCFLKRRIFGANRDEETYQRARKLFVTLIGNEHPVLTNP